MKIDFLSDEPRGLIKRLFANELNLDESAKLNELQVLLVRLLVDEWPFTVADEKVCINRLCNRKTLFMKGLISLTLELTWIPNFRIEIWSQFETLKCGLSSF